MSTPILATKLYIPPPRPHGVRRERLFERLDEGVQRRLTLISAPAGFGKTTLVGDWLATLRTKHQALTTPAPDEHAPFHLAWLALDEGDNELTRFLSYLVAALQTAAPTVGAAALATLQSAQPAPAELTLTALLNEIATLPGQIVLVLDDYHLVDAQPVDAALAFLIERLPPLMHLVMTTREDPQLPLARLRARGQLTELRAADLRFTPAEAASFLKDVMGLDLAVEQVAALEERTEGWIAGLQLAALSMRGHDDVAQFVRSFAGNNRYIVDYLVEEVLRRQPEHLRSFLLQTSILDRLSGPLCDAVIDEGRKTEDENSASLVVGPSSFVLEQLERANLFVVPLDDQRRWFRYHHLFAEVLVAHAQRDQPAQLPALHRRASAWYADHGLPAEAIRHALAGKDFARAAALVELAWPTMDGRFQAATWLGWARALPDELVRTRPVLSAAYAWALLNGGELQSAEARLSDAERLLDSTPESGEWVSADEAQLRALPASIATARAYLAQARGDTPGTVRHGQRALELLPAGDHLRRGPAAALLGLAHWAGGDLEAAHQALAEAMAGFRTAGNLQFALSVTLGLADIRQVQGRLREAIGCYQQALQLAQAQGEPPIGGTADLYLGLSELCREQGDLAAATRHLRHGEELGEQAGLPDWRYRLCRAQARLRQAQGDWAGALELLGEAERHYFPTPLPDLRPLAAQKARIWLAQGRLAEARAWAEQQGLSPDDELSFLREFAHITLARVLLGEHARAPGVRAIQDALRLLDRLQLAAEASGRLGSAIEIGALQALAHQASGNLSAALAALERALGRAEPEGYVGVFVEEGPPMARLLSAAAQGAQSSYVERLLAPFPGQSQAMAGHAAQNQDPPAQEPGSPSPALPLPESLSARELEVLRLIAQGLSNSEIGARLFLALSTVKGHNQNIFEKLQVQRRTEAIARARELGLI